MPRDEVRQSPQRMTAANMFFNHYWKSIPVAGSLKKNPSFSPKKTGKDWNPFYCGCFFGAPERCCDKSCCHRPHQGRLVWKCWGLLPPAAGPPDSAHGKQPQQFIGHFPIPDLSAAAWPHNVIMDHPFTCLKIGDPENHWIWKSSCHNMTLPETNIYPLKIGGWETTFLLGKPIFTGYVSFRGVYRGWVWASIQV